ncbi:MAG: class I SAM-dependent methyltransferase [Saprospiraceae bacterium]
MSQEEAVKSVFDTHAFLYQEKYMDVKAYSVALSLFAENLPSPNPKIIDLACGPANLSFFLKKLVPKAQIHGCDFAPGMIKLAKNNVPDGSFEIADAFHF